MAKIVHVVGTSDTGKETVTKSIVKRLTNKGYEAIRLQEPGPLRDLAKSYRLRINKSPWTEAAIFTTDRLMLYNEKVFPRIKEKNLLFIFDRGLPETVIYQGILGGVDISNIFLMNSEIPPSDIYVCLTVEGRIGYERALKKQRETGEAPSRNETPESIDVLADSYKKYLPRYFDNVHFIDTSNITIDQTVELCYNKVRSIL